MPALVGDPGPSDQTDVLPPRELTVDGVPRRPSREITPEEAVRLAGRGLRSFVLDFGFGAEATAEQLAEVIAEHRANFDGMGPGHPPEAWVHVYGRRDLREERDTQVVVATVLHMRRTGGEVRSVRR